ncbi:hypothetical protein ACFWXI_32630 [[Kitasatospora] papulosa]|uniref:hypothetical protein n=1 Tax=[Kitasatospora] papulosa TaxID=1464011 RepID=UPI0036B80977
MAVLSGAGEKDVAVRAHGDAALAGDGQVRPEGEEHRRLTVRTARDLLDDLSGTVIGGAWPIEPSPSCRPA